MHTNTPYVDNNNYNNHNSNDNPRDFCKASLKLHGFMNIISNYKLILI